MYTAQVWAPLRRGNHSNPSPHNIPPRWEPLEKKSQGRGTNSPIGENPWKKFGSPGRIDTNQGWAPLRKGNHSNLSPRDIPPRGGPLEFFSGAGAQILP